MSKRFMNVLRKLGESPDKYHLASSIPNGHGHTQPRGATATTLGEMRSFGLIEYGKEPKHSLYGWRITDHGRTVLAKGE